MGTILSKVTSARFIVTVSITFTACILAYVGKFPMEIFASLVILVVKDYFERKDRNNGKTPS